MINNEIELIPAVIPESFEEIEKKANLVKGITKIMQVDMMDGKYVTSKSWPFFDFAKSFEEFKEEKDGMPYWQELDYELDLMIEEPEKYLDQILDFSPSRIIIHLSSIKDFVKIEDFRNRTRGFIELGFALEMENTVAEVFQYIDHNLIDFVQLMGIAEIGHQGRTFDERVIDKIKRLREKYPQLPLSVDGGVNKISIPLLLEAEVNRLVAGSAVFGQEGVSENIARLKQLL